MRIFSIGHGARSLDEFVKVLASAKIAALVDVRSFPGSRRHPQFDKKALAHKLVARRVEYAWEPRLGGRRKRGPQPSPNPAGQVEAFRNYADHIDSQEFATGLTALIERAERMATTFMCAETYWTQCHRRLLSDKLWALRWEIVHLISPFKKKLHHPPPFLRIAGTSLRYDLPVDKNGQVRLF